MQNLHLKRLFFKVRVLSHLCLIYAGPLVSPSFAYYNERKRFRQHLCTDLTPFIFLSFLRHHPVLIYFLVSSSWMSCGFLLPWSRDCVALLALNCCSWSFLRVNAFPGSICFFIFQWLNFFLLHKVKGKWSHSVVSDSLWPHWL